jgi:hypothetical protein
MNNVLLNVIRLNQVPLNHVGDVAVRGGGGNTPEGNVPDGYELFLVADGIFSAADGEFYVKL